MDSPGSSPPKLEQLVEGYYQILYRFAFRLSGNAAEAEDLTQETFCQAQDKLHQLREPAKARSWLFTILRNAFLQRKRQQDRQVLLTFEEIGMVADRAPDELPEIDPARLQETLSELPEVYRTPVILYYFEDFSYREIAEQMGVALGTVMSRLSRAKGYLRQRLAPETVENREGD